MQPYNVIILTVEADFKRLLPLYHLLEKNIPAKEFIFIGNPGVGMLLKESGLSSKFTFLDENDLIPFEKVKEIIEDIATGFTVTRGFVGWYYQQFLKFAYANICPDDYYLSWDGDTIPIRPIDMFAGDTPLLDFKREYHAPYFETMKKILPDLTKVIEPSFISEHMLFTKEIVKKLLLEIESSPSLVGGTFYERILRTMDVTLLNQNAFSEFETYGTYVSVRFPEAYKLRRWTSFRNCGQYFPMNGITEDDISWLAKDFHALSFEKGHEYNPEAAFFQNKEYQSKLSARQIVEMIQEDMTDGYVETWD